MNLATPTLRWVVRGGTAVATVLAMAGGAATAATAAPARTTASARPGAAGPTNPYSPAYRHPYRRGVVPTRAVAATMNDWATQHSPQANYVKTLAYGGGVDHIGVTTGDEKVYLVFYGSQWGTPGTDGNGNVTLSGDPSGEAPYLQELFKGLGTGGEKWSGVMTQYCQGVKFGKTRCPSRAPHVAYPHGGALAGAWVDESAMAPTGPDVFTATDLGNEAIAAAVHFGNTTAAANRDVQYVIVSPTGTDPDNWLQNGFCAWHDYTGDSYVGVSSPFGPVAFTNLPYVTDLRASCGQNFVNSGSAGALDGVSIVEGHEYAETITDQFPAGGWTVHNGNSVWQGAENADVCAWKRPGATGGAGNLHLTTGAFAMQGTWSNRANGGKGGCRFTHSIVSTQLLRNPGFERRHIAPWKSTRGVLRKRSATYPAHSGRRLARLDGRARWHTDRLSQKVTISGAYGSAKFSFWLEVKTNAAHRRKADTLTVQVLNSAGKIVRTLAVYSNRSRRNHYHRHTFSLNSYIGQTITLRFIGRERLRHRDTAFLVDDTALKVS